MAASSSADEAIVRGRPSNAHRRRALSWDRLALALADQRLHRRAAFSRSTGVLMDRGRRMIRLKKCKPTGAPGAFNAAGPRGSRAWPSRHRADSDRLSIARAGDVDAALPSSVRPASAKHAGTARHARPHRGSRRAPLATAQRTAETCFHASANARGNDPSRHAAALGSTALARIR